MRKKLSKLTDEQRGFAAENHELVFAFLCEKKVPVEEFYDIVIFGYLKAVQNYFERPDLREYTFGTIAYHQMRSALNHHFISRSIAKRNAVVFSLDATTDVGLDLNEAVTVPASEIYEALEARETWEAIKPIAKPEELEALELRVLGYNGQEIGNMFHLSRNTISKRLRNLRARVCETIDEPCFA